MILPPEIVRQILSGKRTMIRLQAKTDRCLYRQGKAYVLQTHRGANPSCHITIIAPPEKRMVDDQPSWIIRFKKGDTDRDRIPAARVGGPDGDYTDNAVRALDGCDSEVPEAYHARYALEAEAQRTDMLSERRERALDAIREIKKHAPTGKARSELTWAEKRIQRSTEKWLTDAV